MRKFNKDDILEMDFKAYLASSSEEEDGEDEDNDGHDQDQESGDEEEQIKKYKVREVKSKVIRFSIRFCEFGPKPLTCSP